MKRNKCKSLSLNKTLHAPAHRNPRMNLNEKVNEDLRQKKENASKANAKAENLATSRFDGDQ